MTVETFLVWKTTFEAELFALRSEKEREDEKHKKLTGRELFQTDMTLNESDLTFLGDGKLLFKSIHSMMIKQTLCLCNFSLVARYCYPYPIQFKYFIVQ